jgi:type IV secretion system protein VirB10
MQTFEPAREPTTPVAMIPPVNPLPPRAARVAPVEPVDEPAPSEADKMLDAARRAPVMAFNRTSRGPSPASEAARIEGAPYGGLPAGSDRGDDRLVLDRKLQPTLLQGSKAGLLGNRNLVIAMGTSIPCVLETALSSDQPGFTSCVINRDILSDNGRVVLLAKGTQVVGEYRSGLQRGQSRLFVLWSRAKTPEGVIVTLASPATDALGRAGFDGWVDTHWWERFGSALLLSVVGDGTRYLAGEVQNSQVQINGTTQAGQQAAAIAVEQSINIPPTLNKNQGELVSIFVARDLDFSDVYRLRVVEGGTQVYDRTLGGNLGPRPLVAKP